MSKRGRDTDEELGWQSYAKCSYVQPACVNPIELMMQAAKQRQQRAQAQAAEAAAHAAAASAGMTCAWQTQQAQQNLLFPCTHCGQRLPETHLRQCDSCQDVYCSTCSVCNYESRDDRVFCLDCNQGCGGACEHSQTAAPACHVACSPYLSPAPAWHGNGGAFGMRSPWAAGATPTGHLGTPLHMPLGQLGF